jgi:hypothetical protein
LAQTLDETCSILHHPGALLFDAESGRRP